MQVQLGGPSGRKTVTRAKSATFTDLDCRDLLEEGIHVLVLSSILKLGWACFQIGGRVQSRRRTIVLQIELAVVASSVFRLSARQVKGQNLH